MPLYSYQCKECFFVFDLLVGVGKDRSEPKCSSCGSSKIEKLWRAFKINFGKGISRKLSCLNCGRNSCTSCGRN